jgi:hypothetical protein
MKVFYESLHQLMPLGAFFLFCVVFLSSCVHITRRKDNITFNGKNVKFNNKPLKL